MSSVNLMAREIAVKIVFYGPGLSGKTSTLRKIYETVRPSNRGEMMSLATEGDRTLFFDFLPVKVERVGDCAVRLALYTVPGQVFYNATRKLVLQGADGVVFVADSQAEALTQNKESLRNLEENLLEMGYQLQSFPLVMQYNKRDLPKALPVSELRAALNPYGAPEFETCATSGRGVLDGLKTITRLVIKDLKNKKVVPPPRTTSVGAAHFPDDEDGAGLEGQIQQHLSSSERSDERGGGPLPRPTTTQRPTHAQTTPPAVVESQLGPAAALAPAALVDYARAADDAFRRGDIAACVRACQEAVRRGLAFAGEGTTAEQGFLLGVDGTDLLRLGQLAVRPVVRAEDGAFALYVLMQVLTRLNRAGLPGPEV
ncbi:MAG: GTP-binding protein [Myxococcaceae bacterium]|nr:GTP-binding protein [Myxococcaceae bacterium]